MRGGWLVAGLAVGSLGGGCVDLLPYQCAGDDDCRAQATPGRCEAAGYCSYPDDECASGRRFSDLAGPFARTCTEVGPGVLTEAGSTDATTGDGTLGPTTSTTVGPIDSSDSSDSSGPGDPVCGNAVVEAGEECDDGNEADGDGCNAGCVAGGAVVWSRVVAGAVGNDDRYFGLDVLSSGIAVAAVGFIHDDLEQPGNRDALLSTWSADGDEIARVVHDVDGGDDDAAAVDRDGLGRLIVCGRASVGGSLRPWFSRWEASLDAPPTIDDAIPGVFNTCYDIVYLSSSEIVAVGGSNGRAWTYTFALNDPLAGDVANTEMFPGETAFKSVARAADGHLYVAGQTDGLAVVFEPPSTTDLGEPTYTSVVETQPQSMVLTGDGFILGGLLRYTSRDALDDLWIASFDLGGVEQWTWAPMRSAIDEVEDIALDPAGNVYAIGHETAGNLNPDRWVGKLDPAGALIWERSGYEFSDIGDDRGRSIAYLPMVDAVIVVGEFTNAAGDLDAWIARLEP